MKSSPSLNLSDDARRDIWSILRYTRKTWGDRQRNAYAERLAATLQDLARFPTWAACGTTLLPVFAVIR